MSTAVDAAPIPPGTNPPSVNGSIKGSSASIRSGVGAPGTAVSSPKKLAPVRRQSNLSSKSGASNGVAPHPPASNGPASINGSSVALSDAGKAGHNEVDVVFLDPLDKKYECPVCDQVLRYPVQFEECGHRCCSSCLPELLRVVPRCPIDQAQIDREKVYVDKAFQRETDKLGVRCSFFQRACSWTGVLKELMPHLENCQHRSVICPLQCGIEFELRFLEAHQTEDCPKRQIQCQFCEVALSAGDEPEHLEVCGKFIVTCPNGCKKKSILREHLQDHLDNQCQRQDRVCPFSNFGCEYHGTHKKMAEHIKEELTTHLGLLCEAFKDSNTTVETRVQAIEEAQEHINGYGKRIDSLEKLYGAQLIWKVDGYQEKFNDSKSGKKTTIFSAPFLTSRYGYKLALSACLYGDGRARGKSMSLFVCICRGDYDPLLLWPFCHRITFTLIDQCQDPEARKNIIYSVKPNVCKDNKPFLGRPTGERNASFGAQKFVDLEILSTLDYIRDDIMYIKVNIDSEDMIKL